VAELKDIHAGVLEEQALAPTCWGTPALDQSLPYPEVRSTYWRCLEVLTVDALEGDWRRGTEAAPVDGGGGGAAASGDKEVPPEVEAELGAPPRRQG